jgi:hypothetical protein
MFRTVQVRHVQRLAGVRQLLALLRWMIPFNSGFCRTSETDERYQQPIEQVKFL